MGYTLAKAFSLLSFVNEAKDLNVSLTEACNYLNITKDELKELITTINEIKPLLNLYADELSLAYHLDLIDGAYLHNNSKGTGRSAVLSCIDSTNLEMLRNVSNLVSGDSVVCEIQTQGRGRHDHKWHTKIASSLTMSICHKVRHLIDIEGLSIIIGVSISQVLANYGAKVALKWPNDLYYEDKKLCGILIESKPYRKSIYAIIGIGLNVYKEDFVDNIRATSVSEILGSTDKDSIVTADGTRINRTTIAVDIINKIKKNIEKSRRDGLDSFIKSWNKRDYLHGRVITVKIGGDLITGICDGIDSKGNLRLKVLDCNDIIIVESGTIVKIGE